MESACGHDEQPHCMKPAPDHKGTGISLPFYRFDEFKYYSLIFSAWLRMQSAGVQLINWFAMACELHRDWRNDIEGLGALLSNHIPNYRNLMTSYFAENR